MRAMFEEQLVLVDNVSFMLTAVYPTEHVDGLAVMSPADQPSGGVGEEGDCQYLPPEHD